MRARGACGLGDSELQLQRAAWAVASSSTNTWSRNSLRRSTTDMQHVVGGACDRHTELAAWAALGAHRHAAYAELATWPVRRALSRRGARVIINGEYFSVLLLPLAPSLASLRFLAGMELSTGVLLLQLEPRATACRGWQSAVNMTEQMENEEEEEEKKEKKQKEKKKEEKKKKISINLLQILLPLS